MVLPRLHFASELRAPILARRKRATTRVVGEDDPNSDLSFLAAGAVAQAITDQAFFAELRIDRVVRKTLGEVDDALAEEEGCADAAELVALLLKFYPAATAATELAVFHFTLLRSAPAPSVSSTAGRAGLQVAELSWLGFDLDHTVARYHLHPSFELIHTALATALVRLGHYKLGDLVGPEHVDPSADFRANGSIIAKGLVELLMHTVHLPPNPPACRTLFDTRFTEWESAN